MDKKCQMGVVYKLKQEIVDFIIQKKKDNSKISCRGLAQVVQDVFQINVSKSSISEILKNAHLNSPIGRRSEENKNARKYQIPLEKKTFLFNYPSTSLNSLSSLNKQEITTIDKDTPIFFKSNIYSFFIKLVLLELGSNKIFSQIQNHVQENLEILQNINYLETLFLKQIILDSDYNDSFYEENMLFWLIDEKQVEKFNLDEIDLSKIHINEDFFMKNAEVFCRIGAINIFLENGENYWSDAEMSSVWTKKPSGFKNVYVNNFMSNFTNSYIKNTQYLTLFNIYPYFFNNINKIYKNLILCFNNIKGYKIEKILAYDNEFLEIFNFDSIPKIERNFIICIWPWQEEFSILKKYEKIRKKEEFFYNNEKFLYWEEKISIFSLEEFYNQINLKLIVIKEAKTKEPFIAIIYRNKEFFDEKNFVTNFLEKYKYHYFHTKLFNKNCDNKTDSKMSISALFSYIFCQIENHLISEYFLSEENIKLLSRNNKIDSYYLLNRNNINIYLDFQKNDKFSIFLENAVKIVNSRFIENVNGKKIKIILGKPI